MITSLALLVISLLLFAILFPFGLIYGIVDCIKHRRLDYLKQFLRSIALSVDQLGNTVLQYVLNDIMITKDGYKFGNPDETISYVLGRNVKTNTLKKPGKCLCKLLDLFDKNHCLNSIK